MNESRANILPGAALGVVILLGSGAGYRMMASQYARPSDSVPIPRGSLSDLPLHIGEWRGADQRLDQRVVSATDTDDLLNRIYYRRGNESVALFIGYGVNLRDLAPHRPEVCYPSAGWTLDHTRRTQLVTADGVSLPCQVHYFRRGGLVTETVVVLNYYIVDGQTCPDVSLLRSRAWRRREGVSYAAQVQVVCGGDFPVEKAEALVQAFASTSGTAIRSLIVDAVESSLRSLDSRDSA